jgi:CheY-like chemotaxis protein
MNLVLNARDAMPDGGKISIETNNVTLDEEYARTHTGTIPGEHVMISVSDTGTGMTEEVKAHLFEAFFTTKPFGTGLGLPTCRTIVQQSAGHIDVCSELGKGTTFKIYLPRVEQPLRVTAAPTDPVQTLPEAENLDAAEEEPPTLSRTANRILVVDDNISIRELTTEILIGAGFEVDSANDGAAGWEALQAKPYDLVITDNFMPRVTGIEMVKKIIAAKMDLPVIMATAIFPQEEFQLHPWLKTVPTLLKPFRPIELLSAVRKTLSVGEGAGNRAMELQC